MKLKNKIALITGASSGIGKETAIAFAKEGSKVVVTYNTTSGDKTLEKCKKHSETILLKLDVTDLSSIQDVVKKVIQEFGNIDILVNNAGVLEWKKFEKQTQDEIARQVAVNLTGLMQMTKEAMPTLVKQKEAMIINIASVVSKHAYAELTPYCATKFGVRGFTQGLALELPKHVKVYNVNPGLTSTQMTGFSGVAAEEVAKIIIKTAKESVGKQSGDDIDVPEFL